MLLVAVANLQVADLGRVQIPGHGVAAGPLPGPSGARFEGHADAIARVEAAAPNLGLLPAFAEVAAPPVTVRLEAAAGEDHAVGLENAPNRRLLDFDPAHGGSRSASRCLPSPPPARGPPPGRDRLPAPAASGHPRTGACRRPRMPDPRRGERTRLPGRASSAGFGGSPLPASRPDPDSPGRHRFVRGLG